jgi:hypothetical protein
MAALLCLGDARKKIVSTARRKTERTEWDMKLIRRNKREQPGVAPAWGGQAQSTELSRIRSEKLGPDVDTTKIDARMEQGILRLRLPKSERAKPRKIQIGG